MAEQERGRTRSALTGWLFSTPFVLVFAVFGVVPLVASLAMSFTDLTIRDIRTPFAVDFVGFSQFAQLFRDEAFLQALGNTIAFVVFAVPLTIAVGLVLAVLLDKGINRFRSAYRVGFYTPVVTSIVAISIVWRFILQPDGLLNGVLASIGIQGADWLNSTQWALPSLVVVAVWRNMGTAMVLFLAGLQSVPPETHEAAMVDGAGPLRRFFSITLPQLQPTMLLVVVLLSAGLFQFFEEPFVMTGGGPLGSTTSISLFVYQQFGYGDYAYGTAAAYVLFVIIAALAVLQFRLLRSRS